MVAVQLSDEYVQYLLDLCRWWRSKDAGVGDVVIKLAEETGEAGEAYLIFKGFKNYKGTKTCHQVAEEFADAATVAFVGIAMLGFNPADLLEENMRHVKEKHPDAFA